MMYRSAVIYGLALGSALLFSSCASMGQGSQAYLDCVKKEALTSLGLVPQAPGVVAANYTKATNDMGVVAGNLTGVLNGALTGLTYTGGALLDAALSPVCITEFLQSPFTAPPPSAPEPQEPDPSTDGE